ncbi:MAG: hypothetical protein ABSC94_26100 [Polyangiaceae bacterium]|jgi:hypothetical protein
MREGRGSVTRWAGRNRLLASVLFAFGVAVATGFTWGLPGSHSWAADSISPRSCGLGAIVETYRPGHFHTYPPLHMALLSLLSLPWIALAATRVGTGEQALGLELIKVSYMTGIEVSARLLTAAMAISTLLLASRLWSRIGGRAVGIAAAVVIGTNATFVYYAHTGNLEVPYLFWVTWALVELERVMKGEPREMRALLLSTAAVLTKDQAAAALILPVAWVFVVPRLLPRPVPNSLRRPDGRRVVRAVLSALATYAVASGACVNPTGFRRRLAFLFGPASQTWAGYPPGLRGALALGCDAVRATSHFTSRAIGIAAVLGLVVAVAKTTGVDRARRLLPFAAAASFTLFFTLSARRSDDRFLLPQSVFFFPYAGFALSTAWRAWPRARAALAPGAAFACLPAVVGVASLDATLLFDPRYEAERLLERLPRGTHVEVFGGPIFLPRVPRTLVAVRPGVEPVADRQRIAGVDDLVDPAMDPRPRAPAVIVLATELSRDEAAAPPGQVPPFGLMQYRDARSRAFLHELTGGSLGYVRALRAKCTLPWPLECREIHHSTAGEVWIYVRGPSA